MEPDPQQHRAAGAPAGDGSTGRVVGLLSDLSISRQRPGTAPLVLALPGSTGSQLGTDRS
jgi:hypothetical protein